MFTTKKQRPTCPAAKKQKSPKTCRNTLYLFVPSVVKKSLFFTKKVAQPHLNIFLPVIYTMADSEAQQTVDSAAQQPVVSAQQAVDITQQVTSKNPVIKQKKPKRVAAGKLIAEKTRLAREAQKKKLAEADVVLANNQLKKAQAAAATDPPAAEPDTLPAKNVLITTQWLSVISIFISVVGIYYKREEIKKVLTKTPPQAPPPSPVVVAPQRKGGNSSMD